MAKVNPKIFEGWTDPAGGEWIRLKSGTFEGITWRPANLDMDESGKVSFVAEFFEGPGVTPPPEEGTHDYNRLEKVCSNCIHDILASYAAAEA